MKLSVSYKKLWHILLDRDMEKKDLLEATGTSTSTMAKLTKCENINLSTLVKICHFLGCNIGDIMDVLPKSSDKAASED